MRSRHTSTRRRAQANSGEFKDFKWSRGVADDHRIPISRRQILMRLLLYRNSKTGECYPSYHTVAANIGVDRRTVIRAVKDGVRYGWLAKPIRRGPTSNRFVFTFSVKDVTPVEAKDVTPVSKRCDTGDTQTGERTSEEILSISSDGERDDRAARDQNNSPPGGAPNGAPGGISDDATAPAGDDLAAGDPGNGSISGGGRFRALRALWRRGHPGDDTAKSIAIARAAYAKAIGEGAQPEQIVEAAKAWIAAADAPRYLPALPTWLASRCFEQPPPQKKARGQRVWSGPPRGYRPPKPDLASMMLDLGRKG